MSRFDETKGISTLACERPRMSDEREVFELLTLGQVSTELGKKLLRKAHELADQASNSSDLIEATKTILAISRLQLEIEKLKLKHNRVATEPRRPTPAVSAKQQLLMRIKNELCGRAQEHAIEIE